MANTSLTRTMGTPTSRKQFTISVWLKRSAISLSNAQHIWNGYYSADNRLVIYFQNGANDALGFYNVAGGSATANLQTNRQFRDVNGWYHIYYAVDTTQSTASDRIKLYVNGQQETSFSTATYPSQDVNLTFANGYTNLIGNYGGSSNFFDGLMSHFYYVDGSVIAHTEFGETDSTTGEWKIKTNPTIASYGNEGFLILKDGNSVTDQSGNSNNFSVGGGNLTKTEDCPSNVFATINVLGRQAAGYTIENGALSTNGNASNVWRGLYGTIGASSGKFYYECKIATGYADGGNNSFEIGVADAESVLQITSSNGRIANSVRGYSYEQSGTKRNNSSSTSYGNRIYIGEIVGVAVDLDNSKLYFRRDANAWENSGDPTSGSTGTGAISIASGYTYVPAFSTYYSADDLQLNFGNGYFGTTAVSSAGTNASNIGIFEYDVPTGYTALCTKGLNE
mgnify:CR=1 FL=1